MEEDAEKSGFQKDSTVVGKVIDVKEEDLFSTSGIGRVKVDVSKPLRRVVEVPIGIVSNVEVMTGVEAAPQVVLDGMHFFMGLSIPVQHHQGCLKKVSHMPKCGQNGKLWDKNGLWVEGEANVTAVVLDYYSSLFSSSTPTGIKGVVDAIDANTYELLAFPFIEMKL
ncbi:hypothetical protein GH714_035004 [Hevea brasiliensis]|uniref:Uncharacterized protein n=1 Tax=Hevea brasiliensis TaxID=3981 RepID=A0A6A6L8F0_HEVBR|nr:hypothetical protein GH714_035004 [Hevea brasiliensis]